MAREFGCQVSVLDLTEEYCRTGAKLTERTGLTDLVTFHHGNALNPPFDSETFDVAWRQHATMNIDDPRRLYDGIQRVLRPGGIYALYEIMEGDGSPIVYPVPWARDPALSWVQHPDAVRSLLADRGFRESTWEDVSAETLARVQRQLAAPSASPLGLQLVVGPDFPSLFRNLMRNLQERKIRIIRATFERE